MNATTFTQDEVSAPLGRLTDRQAQVLRLLCSGGAQQPSRREMMTVLGMSSTNAIADHLVAIQRKGYIQLPAIFVRGGGLSRAITILFDAEGRAFNATRSSTATPGVWPSLLRTLRGLVLQRVVVQPNPEAL